MSVTTNAASTLTAPVNTARVSGRRQLRFQQLDDILTDAERLASGPVRPLGNWSLGQATGHLARAMQMSLDGFPGRAPWWLRWPLRMLKGRILRTSMRPGFKLPSRVAERFIPDPGVSAEQGLNDLRIGIRRLKLESQRFPHPVLGEMSRQEWDQLHLRHAELHLSFFVPVQ